MERAGACDIFVGAAAVADYRPAAPASEKIKKHEDELTLHLVRNPDILADVASMIGGPFTVGFAAETESLERHASRKLASKALDMIAANLVGSETGGFERADNALLVLWAGGRQALPLMPKVRLAGLLADLIAERYLAQTASQDT